MGVGLVSGEGGVDRNTMFLGVQKRSEKMAHNCSHSGPDNSLKYFCGAFFVVEFIIFVVHVD